MSKSLHGFFVAVGLVIAQGAGAVAVKDCPNNLHVEFHSPQVIKEYARAAYEKYFTAHKKVTEDLSLVRSHKAVCYYEAANPKRILSAQISGSDRQGAIRPLTLSTVLNLPIKGRISGEIGWAIVYTKLESVQPDALVVNPEVSPEIYWMSERCSYGECIPDYILLGEIQAEVSAYE